MREIGHFAHSAIYVTERGVEIRRADGQEMPTAPTAEQAQEARQAIAEALAAINGDRRDYLTQELLTLDYLWGMKEAMEEILRAAFAALDTPAEGAGPGGANKGRTQDRRFAGDNPDC